MSTVKASSSNVAKLKTNVIARDVALTEFERFADSMDLDIDTSVMDEDDLSGFEKNKRRIVKAIERGTLVINDNGEAVYTPSNLNTKRREPLTFYEQDGAALMSLDGKKKNTNVSSTFAVMGSMCHVHPNTFSGMVGVDIKTCMAIFLFLMD